MIFMICDNCGAKSKDRDETTREPYFLDGVEFTFMHEDFPPFHLCLKCRDKVLEAFPALAKRFQEEIDAS